MSPEATALGLRIMDLINQRVKAHEAPYCDAYGHRYRLSARSLFLDFPVALFNRGGVDAKAAIKASDASFSEASEAFSLCCYFMEFAMVTISPTPLSTTLGR